MKKADLIQAVYDHKRAIIDKAIKDGKCLELLKSKISALADEYASNLDQKIVARKEEMKEDDNSHYLIYGVPLPKIAKIYATFNALQVDLQSKSGLLINGKSQACENGVIWGGGGELKVELGAGSMAKVKAPYVLLQGEVKGETDIKETLTVGSSQITVNGQWGGLVAKGCVIIKLRNKKIKTFEVSHLVVKGDVTPTVTIDLPSLH